MTRPWTSRRPLLSAALLIVFTLTLGQLFKADIHGQGASAMPPAEGSETGIVSGPMCQILDRADDAVKAARGKTLCDQAALDLAWYVIKDAANDGPVGGFLRAIHRALSEILSLGESDVEEYLRDKIKEEASDVPDALEDYIKQKISGRKPEVYLNTVSKNGCSVTIRAKWDIAAGTYDIWVEGVCPECTSQTVLTGGSVKRSVPLRYFMVHVHGNVKPKIDHTNLVPSLSFPDIPGPPTVTVTAVCGDTCSPPKTTPQPKLPDRPVAVPEQGKQVVPPPLGSPVGPPPPLAPVPPPAPLCRKPNDCDVLGVIAKDKQAEYERVKDDPEQNGEGEQKFADDQEQSAQKNRDEANRLSHSNGDPTWIAKLEEDAQSYHETAQRHALKAKAQRENVERLRQEAEQAKQAYEDCLRRPLCPEASRTITPPPPPPPPPAADPGTTQESGRASTPLETLATIVGQVLAGVRNVILNGKTPALCVPSAGGGSCPAPAPAPDDCPTGALQACEELAPPADDCSNGALKACEAPSEPRTTSAPEDQKPAQSTTNPVSSDNPRHEQSAVSNNTSVSHLTLTVNVSAVINTATITAVVNLLDQNKVVAASGKPLIVPDGSRGESGGSPQRGGRRLELVDRPRGPVFSLASFHVSGSLAAWAARAAWHYATTGGAAAAPEGGITYSLVDRGKSSGQSMELQVYDPSGRLTDVDLPEGTVLEPVKRGAAKPVAESAAGRHVLREALEAYCVDYAKLAPASDTQYRIAPQAVQDKFKSILPVLKASRELADAGRFSPESNAAAYGESIKQWALWTKIQNWSEPQFAQAFLEKTEDNVAAMNVKWTKQLEQGAKALVPGRWRDVSMVLDRAQKIAAGVNP